MIPDRKCKIMGLSFSKSLMMPYFAMPEADQVCSLPIETDAHEPQRHSVY